MKGTGVFERKGRSPHRRPLTLHQARLDRNSVLSSHVTTGFTSFSGVIYWHCTNFSSKIVLLKILSNLYRSPTSSSVSWSFVDLCLYGRHSIVTVGICRGWRKGSTHFQKVNLAPIVTCWTQVEPRWSDLSSRLGLNL